MVAVTIKPNSQSIVYTKQGSFVVIGDDASKLNHIFNYQQIEKLFEEVVTGANKLDKDSLDEALKINLIITDTTTRDNAKAAIKDVASILGHEYNHGNDEIKSKNLETLIFFLKYLQTKHSNLRNLKLDKTTQEARMKEFLAFYGEKLFILNNPTATANESKAIQSDYIKKGKQAGSDDVFLQFSFQDGQYAMIDSENYADQRIDLQAGSTVTKPDDRYKFSERNYDSNLNNNIVFVDLDGAQQQLRRHISLGLSVNLNNRSVFTEYIDNLTDAEVNKLQAQSYKVELEATDLIDGKTIDKLVDLVSDSTEHLGIIDIDDLYKKIKDETGEEIEKGKTVSLDEKKKAKIRSVFKSLIEKYLRSDKSRKLRNNIGELLIINSTKRAEQIKFVEKYGLNLESIIKKLPDGDAILKFYKAKSSGIAKPNDHLNILQFIREFNNSIDNVKSEKKQIMKTSDKVQELNDKLIEGLDNSIKDLVAEISGTSSPETDYIKSIIVSFVRDKETLEKAAKNIEEATNPQEKAKALQELLKLSKNIAKGISGMLVTLQSTRASSSTKLTQAKYDKVRKILENTQKEILETAKQIFAEAGGTTRDSLEHIRYITPAMMPFDPNTMTKEIDDPEMLNPQKLITTGPSGVKTADSAELDKLKVKHGVDLQAAASKIHKSYGMDTVEALERLAAIAYNKAKGNDKKALELEKELELELSKSLAYEKQGFGKDELEANYNAAKATNNVFTKVNYGPDSATYQEEAFRYIREGSGSVLERKQLTALFTLLSNGGKVTNVLKSLLSVRDKAMKIRDRINNAKVIESEYNSLLLNSKDPNFATYYRADVVDSHLELNNYTRNLMIEEIRDAQDPKKVERRLAVRDEKSGTVLNPYLDKMLNILFANDQDKIKNFLSTPGMVKLIKEPLTNESASKKDLNKPEEQKFEVNAELLERELHKRIKMFNKEYRETVLAGHASPAAIDTIKRFKKLVELNEETGYEVFKGTPPVHGVAIPQLEMEELIIKLAKINDFLDKNLNDDYLRQQGHKLVRDISNERAQKIWDNLARVMNPTRNNYNNHPVRDAFAANYSGFGYTIPRGLPPFAA